MATTYSGQNIEILEGVEAIRKNPGMYIGSTGSQGLVHLVYEAFANAVDEAVAGYGQIIRVTLDREGWVTVEDEGRGIPFDPKDHKGRTLPAATLIVTTIHAGGKFDNAKEGSAYASSGGLHGVGTTAINAFAETLELDSWREGQHFRQIFRQGTPGRHAITPCPPEKHGTRLRWKADLTLFDAGTSYDTDLLISRLKPAAYLNPGLRVLFTLHLPDEDAPRTYDFYSHDGLAGYVRDLLCETEGDEATAVFPQPILIEGERDGVHVQAALLLSQESASATIHSYANSIRTRDGGTHEAGFKAALTRAANDLAASPPVLSSTAKAARLPNKAAKTGNGKPGARTGTPVSFKPEVIQQGLYVALAVTMARPQFQSQSKDRLSSAEVEGITRSIVGSGLATWFAANPRHAATFLRRIEAAQKARDEALHYEQLLKAGEKDRSLLIDRAVSDKFVRCASKKPEECELLLVEGDSAGGSAVQGRNATTQAILKLRGKPKNVAGAPMSSIVDNAEIRTLINVLGAGVGHSFDLGKLAFHKVIIMSDADVDGLHIQCLLLTFFHELMPDLLKSCHVYIAQPPLYKVVYKKQDVWLLDDAARDAFFQRRPDAAGLELKRYKGLGEMNPRELRETTLDPTKRTLLRVTLEDADRARSLIYRLMESKDASPRRAFLEEVHVDVGELTAGTRVKGVA